MTNPESMVERVARAIYEAAQPMMEGRPVPWAVFMFKDRYYARARAVLDALEEPTEEMVEAGKDEGYCASCGYDGLWHRQNPTSLYQAMIRQAMLKSAKGDGP